ncbi:MAG: cell division protein ZapA [Polyangiaceae bacterium]
MERRTIELHIAGQKYRVVSSAGEAELQRLAGIVNAKLREVNPGAGSQPPQAMLLAAMALAHEAEMERCRRESVEGRTRDVLRRMLARVNEALEPGQLLDGEQPPAAGDGES